MSIKACIYDASGNLAGCITDSVLDRFQSEFDSLKKKYFGGIVTPLLGVMEKSLVQSIDKCSADFLNCLKLLSRKYRNDAPIGFVQEASRSYHNLVRYCCSQAVYDEVLQATIEEFRSAGLEYIGGNSQGFDQDDCLFEYKGRKVSVSMRNRDDLYRMWDESATTGTRVVLHDGADEYSETIQGCPADVAVAIVEFVDSKDIEKSDAGILDGIVDVIGQLLGVSDID